MRTTGRTQRLVLAAASLLALAASAQESSAPATFVLKEASPRTGTLIRRNLVMSESLPLNKGYADLTPDQKERVRSQYLGLRDQKYKPAYCGGVTCPMQYPFRANFHVGP